MNSSEFPDQGEIFKSANKKFADLIFFVHFYQGHKKALLRHIRFVNQLGYDAYVFNLKDKATEHYLLPYSEISHKFGMKHALADQIEQHLDLMKEYSSKIMFCFSNISACAFEAMARRPDIYFKALICDSGPSFQFIKSAYRLFTYAQPIPFKPLRLLSTPFFALGWSKELHKDIHTDLKKFRQDFPILSIRGWKDRLISPKDIDEVFLPMTHLNWQKLSLPEAEHLTGLRDFPNEYKPAVENFLKQIHTS